MINIIKLAFAILLMVAFVSASEKLCYRYGQNKEVYKPGEKYDCDECNTCTCLDKDSYCEWSCTTNKCQYDRCSTTTCSAGTVCQEINGIATCVVYCIDSRNQTAYPVGAKVVGITDSCNECTCVSTNDYPKRGQWSCTTNKNCQPTPCQNNDCKWNEICVPDPKQCIRAPCPQYQCVKPRDTCDFYPCEDWQKCEIVNHKPSCVNLETGCPAGKYYYPVGYVGHHFHDACTDAKCVFKKGVYSWIPINQPKWHKNCDGCKLANGTFIPIKTSFFDGCNNCFCNENGQAICTLKACLKPTCKRTTCDTGYVCVDDEENGAQCILGCFSEGQGFPIGSFKKIGCQRCLCEFYPGCTDKARWLCSEIKEDCQKIVINITFILKITIKTNSPVTIEDLQKVLIEFGVKIIQVGDSFQFQVVDSAKLFDNEDQLKQSVVDSLQQANYQVDDAQNSLENSQQSSSHALVGFSMISLFILSLIL